MRHPELSSPHRTTARIILSFAILMMSGAVALASGSTARHSTKRNNASSHRVAVAQAATAPTLSKFFSPDLTVQNGTVTLGFSIGDPDGVPLTGVMFTDALPSGLTVASPNNLMNGCGGTFTAIPGSSSVSLTGGTVQADGCTIFVDVIATVTGTLSNTTGTISSNESGPGTTSNTATLTVVQAPGISKVFGAPTIPLNGTTTLSFTLTNPNTSAVQSNVSFTDTLPSGLVVATPNGLTGTCLTTAGAVVAGTVTANPGSNSISLQSLTLNGSGMCSFSVNVTGTSSGVKANTSGNVSASVLDPGGTPFLINGGTASAMTTVLGPPTISKSFANPGVAVGGTTTLTFTLTNPNSTVALTGVAFTDTFPAGLAVAATPNVVDACGGTFTATPAATGVNLTGGTIAAGGSCTISVSVQVTGAGFQTNTTGAVSSTNGGTGTTGTATISGFDVCIKDDTTGALLQWSSTTGVYLFTDCQSGFTLSGTGTVSLVNGVQTLNDFKSDRRVTGRFNTATLTGNGAVSAMVAPGVWRSFNLRQTKIHPACTCP